MPKEISDTLPEPKTYQQGQTTAWENSWQRVYDKLGDVILMYARQEGLNEHSAQDVLQEAMVTVLRAKHGEAARRDPNRSFRHWLKGVVHNRIRTVRRKDRKEAPLPPQPGSGGEDEGPSLPEIAQPPDDVQEMDEREWHKAILAAALQRIQGRMKKRDNFAIFLALLEEKATPEELAAQYGKTRGTVDKIKHDCQKMMMDEAKAIAAEWEKLGHLPA